MYRFSLSIRHFWQMKQNSSQKLIVTNFQNSLDKSIDMYIIKIWNGERISNAEGRRMMNAKTYIDLKDDTLHSDNYWNDDLKDAAQAIIDEAIAEIEAEEKAEAEKAQAEELKAEEAQKEQETNMENEKWYAVMTDRSDSDWGTGSFDRDEAERMVVRNLDDYPDGYIAVIENGVCVDEIVPADFSVRYDVEFASGPSRNAEMAGVDYMLVDVEGIELYAELENPTWNEELEGYDDDWATFEDLKADIISQAKEKNIPVELLNFLE